MTMLYLKEIEQALLAHPKKVSADQPQAYIGGGQSKLRYLGLKTPQIRATLKSGFSFYTKSPGEIAKIWDEVWRKSDCFEVLLLALIWFDDSKQSHILCSQWSKLKSWSQRIDNWVHADLLSGIYAKILEQNPNQTYKILQDWSRSSNPWLRRLSNVSLIYYSRARKKFLPAAKVLALVKPQLNFEDFYVQKGVGWTLREAANIYPKEISKFIMENALILSPEAFSSAIKNLPRTQKEKIKLLRKTHRS